MAGNNEARVPWLGLMDGELAVHSMLVIIAIGSPLENMITRTAFLLELSNPFFILLSRRLLIRRLPSGPPRRQRESRRRPSSDGSTKASIVRWVHDGGVVT